MRRQLIQLITEKVTMGPSTTELSFPSMIYELDFEWKGRWLKTFFQPIAAMLPKCT
jgi:hypothetical protein